MFGIGIPIRRTNLAYLSLKSIPSETLALHTPSNIAPGDY